MADKKISALTGAVTPLAGTEVLPIVQGGATVKVSVDNLTEGKTVKAADLQLPWNDDAEVIFRFDDSYKWGMKNPSADNRSLRVFSKAADGAGRIIFAYGNDVEGMRLETTGNVEVATGNVVMKTAGKGIVDSTSAVALNFSSTAATLNSPLAQTGAINTITNDFTGHINGAFALNDTATISNLANGFIEIAENAFGACALIMVGTGATTIIAQSTFLLFSTIAGNPGTVNIYKSGANVIIENKNAATLTIVTSIRKLG